MNIIYDKLPQEIQSRINNIIIDNYEKIYNKYKKRHFYTFYHLKRRVNIYIY